MIPIYDSRSASVRKTVQGTRFLTLIMAIVATSMCMTMTGCSSAAGTDLAPREDVLKTLRSQGFLFNRNVISTVYGENQKQVIVSGQLAQKTPDSQHVPNGYKVTQYRTIIVESADGGWKVKSATPVQREQLSSRQRW